MIVFLRRLAISTSVAYPHLFPFFQKYSSKSWPSKFSYEEITNQSTTAGNDDLSVTNHSFETHSLPLFQKAETKLDSGPIQIIDSEAWSVSSSLVPMSSCSEGVLQLKYFGLEELDNKNAHNLKPPESNPDFDDVEDMRIRGNLFYKIEHNSMEFKEYEFDYHGKKSKSRKIADESDKKDNPKCGVTQNGPKSLESNGGQEVISEKGNFENVPLLNKERLAQTILEEYVVCAPGDRYCVGKKQRNLTFNQLTGPYHEPFCLDIYVSKGSVRACVIHRVTSKVVVVAHSISKDMKFDLGSTKSVNAALSVGKVLAQRALEDDIHDVIYTPRKGDRLEGKLQVVLQSIMDNGINVKVKLKQRNMSKTLGRSTTEPKINSDFVLSE